MTEREILVAVRDGREPKQLLAGLDVNVRFAHRGFALLGSGAKAKVAVRGDGSVSEAYRFWRDLAPNGEATTRSLDELFERFSASDLFADLTDNSARAEVVSARFGYFTLPRTEPDARAVTGIGTAGHARDGTSALRLHAIRRCGRPR